ncbi:MAG: acyl-CoA thioesterase [Desulfobulbaceae bacterium]|nr:acyl-CoA thioesterase [Desulfobulbaceae bacterium]HIJ77822.1 acyl-CoA thioesterase [Deltaproteobacteria bacterium]
MVEKSLSMHEPLYRHQCRVIYGDTDSGGVVYYANYLRYFEAARTEFMREQITSYKSIEDEGFILPVVECHVRYKASALYDDLLVIETCLLDVKAVSCRFNYRIIRQGDGKVLIQGYTVHAVVDRTGKLAKLPGTIMERLQKNSVKP